jgi:hypothetical protein
MTQRHGQRGTPGRSGGTVRSGCRVLASPRARLLLCGVPRCRVGRGVLRAAWRGGPKHTRPARAGSLDATPSTSTEYRSWLVLSSCTVPSLKHQATRITVRIHAAEKTDDVSHSSQPRTGDRTRPDRRDATRAEVPRAEPPSDRSEMRDADRTGAPRPGHGTAVRSAPPRGRAAQTKKLKHGRAGRATLTRNYPDENRTRARSRVSRCVCG